VWGPGELADYFSDVPFHATSRAGLFRAGRGADVIHAHGLTAALVAVPVARPPVVVSLHVVTGSSGRTETSGTARLLAKAIVARSDAVVAASALAARGFDRARVIAPAFAPLAAPVHDRDQMRRVVGSRLDDVVVVTVSRLEESKRLDLFIRAVEGSGATGWIVGDGSDRRRIEALAADTSVMLLGQREDVSDILGSADIFALPSASESYGIAVAEAIDAGLPVVATRTGAVEDLVGAGGILLEPGDDNGFTSAVARLVREPKERARLVAAAREVDRPDSAALTQQLGDVYDEVSSRRS
jgi:glycosyltransferase involved in cell wall biosynthesis